MSPLAAALRCVLSPLRAQTPPATLAYFTLTHKSKIMEIIILLFYCFVASLITCIIIYQHN